MRTFLALVCLLAVLASSANGQDLALVGATLYDGTGGPPLADAVVTVRDGRIACVGTAADCAVPAGTEAVDLTGQFLTPGLVDAHVHYTQTGWLDGRPDSRIGTDGTFDYPALQASLEADPGRWDRAYLCSGVTAVLDPGGLPWTLGLQTDGTGTPERPHVVAAGPLLTHFQPVFGVTAVGDDDTFLQMRTDEEATASVRQLAELGADAVKVWYIDPPLERRAELDARLVHIGREAQAAGLPLIVHATELRNAKAALRAGAAILVHSVDDQPVDDEFIRLAGETGVIYTPTLRVYRNWRRAVASAVLGVALPIDDPNGCVDAETRRLIEDAPALQATVAPSRRDPARVVESLVAVGRDEAVMDANLIRLWRAGVTIATSTDAGNPLTLHGPAIYAEMEAMEAAGIPPAEVLEMSTRNGARAMGRLDDFGTVEAGKLADLVVLTEDPGASTSAFRSITHVARGGVLRPVSFLAAD